MARLFGLIGNRADLAARVLEIEREKLRVPEGLIATNGPISWGIGFYQAGEVLLRRRPNDDRRSVDVAVIAKDARADLLIGHVRSATVGGLRAENTHPFRYREWLFAHTGALARYESLRPRLLESIPEFLRKNLRGDTDSEIIFHVILSFLHDAGRLHDGDADGKTVSAALSSTASLLDHLVAEEGGEPGFTLNALLSNGELLAALHREGTTDPGVVSGATMAIRTISGRAGLDALVADDPIRKVRLTDPGALRFSIIASDFAPDQLKDVRRGEPVDGAWTALPPRAIVVTTRDAQPKIETL